MPHIAAAAGIIIHFMIIHKVPSWPDGIDKPQRLGVARQVVNATDCTLPQSEYDNPKGARPASGRAKCDRTCIFAALPAGRSGSRKVRYLAQYMSGSYRSDRIERT